MKPDVLNFPDVVVLPLLLLPRPLHLHPLLDDELPHLAGPLVTEPAEVEAGQGVVDPLQEEDDETSLLSEGILSYVGESATELSLLTGKLSLSPARVGRDTVHSLVGSLCASSLKTQKPPTWGYFLPFAVSLGQKRADISNI